MAENLDNKVDVSQKLKDKYRLILLNDETLQEIRSFTMKTWQLIALFILGFIAAFLLAFAFIYFTPLKTYITNWGGIENNAAFVDLNKKLFELETEITELEVYKSGFENMLNDMSAPDEGTESNDNRSASNASSNLIQEAGVNDMFISPPLTGIISAEFDPTTQHYGVDIVAPKNTAIKAIMPGTVVLAEWNPKTGYSISIQHHHGLVSIYKHNSSLLKEKGDIVQTGESVAIIGNTGILTTGPHLHFEIWQKGIAINPSKYINFE